MTTDRGTSGALYTAGDVDDPERPVAAKVFYRASNAEPVYRTFLRELRGMRRESHRIGEIIDSGKDPRSGAAHLISPHYRPGSLNVYAGNRNGRVPLSWSMWVLAGLGYASTERIARLDIKPQNIILYGPGNVSVDWGTSRLQDDGLTSSPRLKPGDSRPHGPGFPLHRRPPSRLAPLGSSIASTGVPPLRRPGGEDVLRGVDVPVMGRATGALPRPDAQQNPVARHPARRATSTPGGEGCPI